jgi:transposase-like protein
MAKCPYCKKEMQKPKKSWKYGIFQVKAYTCSNCGTEFRDYELDGMPKFTLRLKKGKGYVKA